MKHLNGSTTNMTKTVSKDRSRTKKTVSIILKTDDCGHRIPLGNTIYFCDRYVIDPA